MSTQYYGNAMKEGFVLQEKKNGVVLRGKKWG
jgi:hypothetical protein